jgi:hypothetical protein
LVQKRACIAGKERKKRKEKRKGEKMALDFEN